MGPAYAVLGAAVGVVVYTYAGYPALLWFLSRLRRRREGPPPMGAWPMISILIPARNAEATLRDTLEAVLALDYPVSRRQVVVVSDASTDRTDAIAHAYAPRGVELLRLPRRRGKTAAENFACRHLRGHIVVTVDAAIVVAPASLKALIGAFGDATVGVASGQDISVARTAGGAGGRAEWGYVGYEMRLRRLETAVAGIVGASGCFYAERATLYERPVPEHLSRDFLAPLVARERGYRAVAVQDAVCYVPRSSCLRDEYRRKVRTITRGIATVWYKRALLNPLRYGAFAWMLASHKLCRWLVPWTVLPSAAALLALSETTAWARATLVAAVAVVVVATGSVRLLWQQPRRPVPSLLALLGDTAASNVAVLHAWWNVARGRVAAAWEPTVRLEQPSRVG